MLFFALTITVQGQKKSKGDDYFFSYAFKDAISAYEEDISDGELLTSKQYLNLADAYFEVEDFNKANDIYLNLFANDSIMGQLPLQ